VREVTDAEVRAAVDDRALVDACTAALAALGRGEASQAAKQMLPAAGGGFFLSISAVVPALGWAISKWASYVPADGGAGRSTSTILAGAADGSAPTAVLRGMLPTRLRTAAAAVAAIEALGRADAASPVALVGFGPTNRAVADMLATLHGVRSWRVLVRSDAAGDRARAALPGEVVVGGRDALADAVLAVSATGAGGAVASVADLAPGAAVVCLDGARVWETAHATLIDDRSTAHEVGGLARLVAGLDPAPDGAVLIDQAGSAVTDVALASVALGEPQNVRDRW
jgi:ornithine cyclodeaminase/alanine dehydrogenase-like protein (mu-crystallin family)